MAERIVNMFGDITIAEEYIILWQDEYTSEKDKLFRLEVKKEIENYDIRNN